MQQKEELFYINKSIQNFCVPLRFTLAEISGGHGQHSNS